MALAEIVKRLTTTIPLEYRPADTMDVKVKFVQEDGVTPFDMTSFNLNMEIYAPTISTQILASALNKIPDGTEQASKIVAVRESKDDAGNDMFVLDDGIYLEDFATSTYRIQYGKEEGVVFLLGTYIMNLYARFEHGKRRTLLSFSVRFHNEIVDTGTITYFGSTFTLPILRTEVPMIPIVIPNQF